MLKPRYRCESCKREYVEDRMGPTRCHYCQHPYVRWLNYEECTRKGRRQ